MKENPGPSTRDRGQVAENLVADFLRKKGYRIVDRNFVCRFGEIDIVARDGEDLVFVEVRSRKTSHSLDPIYSVDWRKQQKVIKAAQIYLSQRPACAPIPSRFDVVIVTLGPQPEMVHINDAFQTDGLSDHGIQSRHSLVSLCLVANALPVGPSIRLHAITDPQKVTSFIPNRDRMTFVAIGAFSRIRYQRNPKREKCLDSGH